MIKNISDEIALNLATDILFSENLVIMPCDTIYGILGLCPETETRISKLKGRSPEKPYIRLVGEVQDLERISVSKIPDEILDMLPAPLTLLLLDEKREIIGVRVPDDNRLLEVLHRLNRPLFSTSVNKSGSPPLWKIADIIKIFATEVDLILDGGDLPGGMPSTVLDITRKPYRVVRQGGFIIPSRLLEV